jgi:hypothetical protein
MTSTAMGEGERAYAARQARMRWIIAAQIGCAAAIIGVAIWFRQDGGGIAPTGAIGIAVLYLVAMLGCGWWACRRVDEVEMAANIRALAASAIFFGLVYPPWYFIWKAGLTIEPVHEALYAGAIAVAALSYCWVRLRR